LAIFVKKFPRALTISASCYCSTRYISKNRAKRYKNKETCGAGFPGSGVALFFLAYYLLRNELWNVDHQPGMLI